MATRYYFTNNTVPDISPAFDGNWSSTTGALRRVLTSSTATPEQTPISSAVASTIFTVGHRWLSRQYVSGFLGSQVLSGLVNGQMQVREFATGDDLTGLHVCVRVVDSAGNHKSHLVNLSAVNTASTAVNEFINNASFRNHSLAKNFTISSYTCSVYDRLVIEIGYQAAGTGATPQGALKAGTTGASDLPQNETTATSGIPWFEFSSIDIVGPKQYWSFMQINQEDEIII